MSIAGADPDQIEGGQLLERGRRKGKSERAEGVQKFLGHYSRKFSDFSTE